MLGSVSGDKLPGGYGGSAQGAQPGPASSMSSGSLLSLAPELILVIAEELDIHDVEHLRLTCRTLAPLLTSRVFRVLNVKVTKNSLRRDITKLRTLATTSSPASSGTQTLRIGALAPGYDPEYQGPAWKYVNGEWVAEAEEEEPPDVALAAKDMGRYLVDAISTLKAVKRVEWIPNRQEDPITQKAVMHALMSLPNLSSIDLSLTNCKVVLPLDAFSTIREISLIGTCETQHDATLDNLAKLIAQAPALRSVDITSSWRYNESHIKMQSLHDLFKYYPRDAPPLQLQHLALKVCLVLLDDMTLPHLRHLTSLELTNIEDPYTRQKYIVEDRYDDADLRQEQKQFGSSHDDIWKALKGADIWLGEIVVDAVVPALLDYLNSYSGLRRLVLTPGGFHDGRDSDVMASEFFSTSLAKHAASLQELHIEALYEGGWCFNAATMPIVSTCQNLRILRMSIASDDLDPRFLGKASESDVIELLIDTVALSMPHVKDLQIFPANLEQLRGAFCGNPAMSHFSHTIRLMVENVIAYRAPSSCARLPNLIVGSRRVFEARSVAGSEQRMRYVDMTSSSQELEYAYW